jgi:membrane-associated phospholipid phosphatase
VFAAAAAATQVARLRGRRGWEWVAAAGFTAAAATGWLRVAADQHWATDVLAAAAVGTAVGWAIPTFSLRPVARAGGATVVPAPGGFAIVF